MTRTVVVVPHTHWDREWYASYQTFRLRLVELGDQVLDTLEQDPSYAHFQLDGQMAALDDYLAIRPDAEPRLRRLAVAGRLSVGPWYTLPDEFLVSGETLIRNLQLGIERAGAFGGAMEVGYLPDMFGHVGQMPQLLRQFDLEHAVVWRGVPAAVDRDAFLWQSPDGSTVRAEYLLQGYGNGAYLPDDAKDLVERVRRFEADHDERLHGPVLWMHGTDHQMPRPRLGRVVAEANEIQDDYELRVTSLAAYLEVAAEADAGRSLPHWRGELRSGAHANLLMGVASNRVDVKQAAACAERALERRAEPWSALTLPADAWPERLLDEAWLGVIRNAAHDSVCACSIDQVTDAVLARYHDAVDIADGLAERALRVLGERLREPGATVVNPSARPRSGVVELRLPGEGDEEGMQLVSQRPTRLPIPLTRADALQVVQGMLEQQGGVHAAEVELVDDTLEVTLRRDPAGAERVAAAPVLDRMREVGGADPTAAARITVVRPPVRRMLAHVHDVPGFGWRRWEAEPPQVQEVTADGRTLDNGLVRVEIDEETGTFTCNGLRGLGHLVDDGDGGDTYNHDRPARDRIVDRPDEVGILTEESGPLRARIAVESTYTWPDHLLGGARVGERRTQVRTTLELRAGEELVRVEVALDNGCRDHRLRAWFPLPEPATTSRAECAFAVVERGLEAEGGPTERPLPTFPSRRFVQAGGLTVIHEGLLEYELIDIHDGRAHALALTLLRCTGMLSQGPMPSRPLPAGPLTATPGAQMQGPQRLRYAVHVGDADPYALADDAFLPLEVITAPGGGDLPPEGHLLRVEGAEVSAVRREGGTLTVRVFNPADTPTRVRMGDARGWLVDLRGRPVEPFEGGFQLGPHRIATARLTEHG